ncbi:MAG: putative toxin-antitoxin system toxin component, PIN family [Acidobacteriaceae bacterium]|nr:putative toxin-antitoxin system toxin component, PIN family [Acidobacteriaceae bacterium]MBV9765531.1 putative toxin-antitoxin system toxin component, PIN family [Acidobacteriaceae bacterium]
MIRAVLDTDVVVAAFRSDSGASRRVLEAALDREVTMLVSVPLMLEYESVLTRSDQLQQSGLTVGQSNIVLDAVAAVAERVPLRFLWRPLLRDANDEMVLETAVNGRADCLITFNMRHLSAAAKEFGIRAILPRDFLKSFGESKHAKK